MLSRLKSGFLAFLAGLCASLFGLAAQAQIVAGDLEPISDGIEATMTAIKPWAIGILVAILVVSIGIKLVKKFAGKAA